MSENESEKNKLSGNFQNDVKQIDKILRTSENFDIVKRILTPRNKQKCAFFYIAGFANSQVVQDFLRYCISAEDFLLTDSTIPYVEATVSDQTDIIIKKLINFQMM